MNHNYYQMLVKILLRARALFLRQPKSEDALTEAAYSFSLESTRVPSPMFFSNVVTSLPKLFKISPASNRLLQDKGKKS